LAGERCLICGSDQHAGQKYLHERLAKRRCPACKAGGGEKPKGARPSEASTKRLEEKQIGSAKLEVNIARLERLIKKGREELVAQLKLRSEAQQASSELRLQKQRAENRARLPAELATIEQEIRENEVNLREKAEVLQHLRSEYETRLAEANSQIEVTAQAILERFKEYADRFLLEKVVLRYEFHERLVGQSGQTLKFPNFVVALSLSDSEPTDRPEIEQVSQSQREFIDLAFRMALLDVAVSTHGPTMIAIETPEASLDTVFVVRAGEMLRAFAKSHPSNRVIATCNINGEGMIGRLLGTVGQTPKEVPMESLARHIVNLLEVGRKTRAYETEKASYDAALKRAIYGQ
jgi:hypothetical protein